MRERTSAPAVCPLGRSNVRTKVDALSSRATGRESRAHQQHEAVRAVRAPLCHGVSFVPCRVPGRRILFPKRRVYFRRVTSEGPATDALPLYGLHAPMAEGPASSCPDAVPATTPACCSAHPARPCSGAHGISKCSQRSPSRRRVWPVRRSAQCGAEPEPDDLHRDVGGCAAETLVTKHAENVRSPADHRTVAQQGARVIPPGGDSRGFRHSLDGERRRGIPSLWGAEPEPPTCGRAIR